MNHNRRCSLLFLFAALLAIAGMAYAQESRGSINGRVTDASGAVITGAKVTVVNLGTNATMALTTNAAGQYSALYLSPGTYSVTVELEGFTKTVNESVDVRVGDKIPLDFVLSPKGVTETIEVVSTRPLLDQGTATSGQIIDGMLITELPNGDGTAYAFTRLVPATTFEGGYALQRPMDNGNLFGERVGGTGRSEFTLDGSSNVVNVSGSAAMGISPPAEAVQEFKFETVSYDAQVGHTGAGAVNLALKSGANALHGTAYFYNRSDSRSANDFASNAQGMDKPPRNYNRFGATITGPIVKNHTFFMVSYENLADKRTEPATYTVPTQKMRDGDFSELLPSVVIYDPATARLVGSAVVRDPFPGNIIPASRISPIARNVLQYYPLPNQEGKADKTQNFFVQQPWDYTYDLEMIRLDQQWSQNHRTYVRFTRNWRDEERYNWTGEINGVNLSRGLDQRYNYNLALGHTALLSPTLVLDVKAAALRFESVQTPTSKLNPAELGFSQITIDQMRGYEYVPAFYQINNGISSPGYLNTAYGAPRNVPFYNYSFNPTLTKTTGGHVIKVGYELRMLRENRLDEGYKGGRYTFDGTYTRAASNTSSLQGQGLAALLLGLPSSGIMDTTASRANEVVSHSVFIQDDWRVSSKLTLNIGLRYDYEQPLTERYNRNTRGFDLTSESPIAAQAQAKYASNYAAKPSDFPVAPSGFQVRGGYTFASEDNRQAWDPVTDNIQPRFGFAYKLNNKTVMRGGVGLYVPLFEIGGPAIGQTGFSRSTSASVTQNNGLTFSQPLGNVLSNPFPNGLSEPIGSSLGLATNMGNNTPTIVPLDRKNAKYWRYTFSVQRELPGRMVVELAYAGSRAVNLTTTKNLNDLPQQYRTTTNARDVAQETYLGASVANPFQGLLPDAPNINGGTIARSRLLVAYPQFGTTMNQEFYDGSSGYNAVSIRLEKQFSKGLSIITNYTYSRLKEKISRLNSWEDYENRLSAVDRPHRFVFATVAQLPFGKDRKWGSNWNPVIDGVLGGWAFSVNYQFQSGEPYSWDNRYWDTACGDPMSLKTHWGYDSNGKRYGIDVPAFDTSCFYFHDAAVQVNGVDDPAKQRNDTRKNPGSANIRTFPTTWNNFRAMNHNSLDVGLSKSFHLGGNVKLDVRIDAINALNTTIFRANRLDLNPSSASFGTYTAYGQSTVVMYPRDFQIGAKLTF